MGGLVGLGNPPVGGTVGGGRVGVRVGDGVGGSVRASQKSGWACSESPCRVMIMWSGER